MSGGGIEPARVKELVEQGFGRNAVARELGVSYRAVDEVAKAEGITWDRSRTKKATAALVADAQHELSSMFSETASVAARRLLEELQSDDPNPHLIRALASASDLPAGRLLSIAERMTDGSADDTESLLGRLAAGVNEWAEHLANQPPESDRPT